MGCWKLRRLGLLGKITVLREAARIFREPKISNENRKIEFFLFYQNIAFCELVSKKIF